MFIRVDTIKVSAFPCPVIISICKFTKAYEIGSALSFIIELTSTLIKYILIGYLGSRDVAIGISESAIPDRINIQCGVIVISHPVQGFSPHKICISQTEYREVSTSECFIIMGCLCG